MPPNRGAKLSKIFEQLRETVRTNIGMLGDVTFPFEDAGQPWMMPVYGLGQGGRVVPTGIMAVLFLVRPTLLLEKVQGTIYFPPQVWIEGNLDLAKTPVEQAREQLAAAIADATALPAAPNQLPSTEKPTGQPALKLALPS